MNESVNTNIILVTGCLVDPYVQLTMLREKSNAALPAKTKKLVNVAREPHI